jgi:hypothetical protein
MQLWVNSTPYKVRTDEDVELGYYGLRAPTFYIVKDWLSSIGGNRLI